MFVISNDNGDDVIYLGFTDVEAAIFYVNRFHSGVIGTRYDWFRPTKASVEMIECLTPINEMIMQKMVNRLGTNPQQRVAMSEMLTEIECVLGYQDPMDAPRFGAPEHYLHKTFISG